MTPFEKKFPQADKDTVFVVRKSTSSFYDVGDSLALHRDRGGYTPLFHKDNRPDEVFAVDVGHIELANQEEKPMTPFQKKFPNADENTVFVVTEKPGFNSYIGERVVIENDYGTDTPYFKLEESGEGISFYIERIELAEPEQPEFKLGDKVDCRYIGSEWITSESIFIADVSEVDAGFSNNYLCKTADGGIYTWDQVRHAKTTETIRFQDGLEIEISADEAKELRDRL